MTNIGMRSLRIFLGLSVCLPALAAPAFAQNSTLDETEGAEIIVTGSRIPTIKGFINNAFNRKTYAYGLDLRGAGFPYPFLVPAAPRTFGGSVRVTF